MSSFDAQLTINELLALEDDAQPRWLDARQALPPQVYHGLKHAGGKVLESTLSTLGVDGIGDLGGLEPLVLLTPGGVLWEALDTLSSDLDREFLKSLSFEGLVVGTSAVAASGLSVGYVIWLLRGGSLMLTMVTALPTWMSFDPLPILGLKRRTADAEAGGESLLQLIQNRTRRGAEGLSGVEAST